MRRALAALVSVLLLVSLGVWGEGVETSSVPAPDSRDAYRPRGWSGGEHILRVQRCGRDHVLLWLDLTHVIGNATVRRRDASGNLRETLVMIVSSDAGMTAELPDNAWWRDVAGMNDRVPVLRPPKMPDAAERMPGEGPR